MSPQMVEALRRARDTKQIELGRGVLERTGEVFRQQFAEKKPMLVVDRNTLPFAQQAMPKATWFILEAPNLYADHAYVKLLEIVLGASDVIPVAVGSGTINDLTKLAAHR